MFFSQGVAVAVFLFFSTFSCFSPFPLLLLSLSLSPPSLRFPLSGLLVSFSPAASTKTPRHNANEFIHLSSPTFNITKKKTQNRKPKKKMSPPRPRGGNSSGSSSSDNSWQSWLDRNRFYVMALVGFMLVGYLMSQRGGGGAAPVSGRRVSPGGGKSSLPAAETGGRVHNKGGDVKPAMGNKPAPTKVRAKNEPREDDKWLGVSDWLESFFFRFRFRFFFPPRFFRPHLTTTLSFLKKKKKKTQNSTGPQQVRLRGRGPFPPRGRRRLLRRLGLRGLPRHQGRHRQQAV